jgi:hypothetical protein
MAFVTKQLVRNVAHSLTAGSLGVSAGVVLEERRKLAEQASKFDVFLSHAREDAEIVLGVVGLLELLGKTVYVDWISDVQLDRSKVTPLHASVLRSRMRSSASLLYLTTANSVQSIWMPWELGYFDGHKPGHVAILPVLENGMCFEGQEFLGLYPVMEYGVGAGASYSNWSISDGGSGRINLDSFVSGSRMT